MSFFPDGQSLNGDRFKILQILGGGGFGVTYLAENLPETDKSKKLVAIKTLNKVKHGSSPNFEELQDKFVEEALVLAGFHHPNIVQIYPKFFRHNGLCCIVMEYIPGKNLVKYLEDQGVFAESDALRIIKDIGNALTVVHQQNFLHRDIKPENIILREPDKVAKLIDFGLAREVTFGQIDSLTSHRTEGYAPPEQYERKGEFTPALDVYSLAATLYVLLTFEPLPPANFRKQFNIPLTPPNQLKPKISPRVNDGILAGLELDPKKRPQSVAVWLDLLGLTPPKPQPSTPPNTIIFPTPKTQTPPSSAGVSSPPLNKGGLGGVQPALKTFQFEVVTVTQTPYEEEYEVEYEVEVPSGVFGWKKTKEIKKETKKRLAHQLNTNRRPGKAEYFTLNLPKGVTMDLVSIPGGKFLMGAPASEQGSSDSERPQHWVTVPPFFLGKYQVTQAQWEAVMGNNPSNFKGPNRPVECVSWDDCDKFCKKLSELTKKNVRLPSEAEWEYACRAGTTTPFYFGETITPDLANYDGRYTYGSGPKGKYRKETTDVGIFPPNAFGLYDMHGNVWEWCQDCWHENYNNAPVNGAAWNDNHFRRVLRGGYWTYLPRHCRAVSRYRNAPDYRYPYCGVRVALLS